jgi:hypothetical protein
MLFQPCVRHLAQIYSKWSLCNMDILDSVRKYLPKSDTMLKVHMNQIRHHIRSTQPAVTEQTP